jgi:hypothetical protein
VRRHCLHAGTFDSQDVSYLHDWLRLREKALYASPLDYEVRSRAPDYPNTLYSCRLLSLSRLLARSRPIRLRAVPSAFDSRADSLTPAVTETPGERMASEVTHRSSGGLTLGGAPVRKASRGPLSSPRRRCLEFHSSVSRLLCAWPRRFPSLAMISNCRRCSSAGCLATIDP